MTRAETRSSPQLSTAGVAGRLGAVAAVCSLGLLCLLCVRVKPWHNWFDLRVYRGAISWWLDGNPLYAYPGPAPHELFGFTYPPFAALVLMPLALVGLRAAELLQLTACLAVVAALTARLVRPVARRAGWTPWVAVALAVPLVVVSAPVWETLSEGQVNVFLMALVLADLAALRSGRRWAGIGIGVAAAIKLTPAVFVLYLLLSGRLRAALVAVVTAATATALGFVVAPSASVAYWSTELWDTGRVGQPEHSSNHSLLGVLSRWAAPHQADRVLWAVLAVGVLALALGRAARAARGGDELVGATLTGLAACLVSPISWTHHLVWVVPAGVVLLDLVAGRPRAGDRAAVRGVRLAAGAGLAGLVALFWLAPFQQATTACDGVCRTVPGGLAQSSFTLALLALVVLLPARAPVGSSRSGRDVREREGQGDLDLADGLLDHQ